MADTLTTNYSLTKPEVTGSADTWGTKLNADLDTIDTTMKAISTVANAALPKAGGTVTGDVLFDTGKCGTTAKPSTEAHCSKFSLHAPGGSELAGISTLGFGTFVDVTVTSDMRWKENIEALEIEPLLQAVLGMDPVSFNWKKDPRPALGLIAQNVVGVLPRAVTEMGERLTLQPMGVIAALVGAVRALHAEVQQLRREVESKP